MVKAYPNIVVNKVTKSIKIYQYFRYLKFASSASQNAGKCVSKSLGNFEFLDSWRRIFPHFETQN